MTPKPDPIRAAIAAHLIADEDLMAIATGGVHHVVAPAKTEPPYVIFQRHAGTKVWSMRDFFRDQLWLVKGVCRGLKSAPAEAIDARCEELLDNADLAIEGAHLMYLRRESDMPAPARYERYDGGEAVLQAGGLYRLRAEPT